MATYTDLDNYVITPTASTVTRIDTSKRGGDSIIVKAAAANTSIIYVGRSSNQAGTALSNTTGYPLAAGESVSLDLETQTDKAGCFFACYTTGTSQNLHVLVLKP